MSDQGRLLPGAKHFIVSEDPAYAPCGSGEHAYVEIEKEGHTTDTLAQALAKACGVPMRAIGYAGRKDRHAITRQWFSIHTPDDPTLENLAEHLPANGRIAICNRSRHKNKIRLGHLRGNVFDLGITGISEAELRQRCAALQHHGLINRFGPQRFGHGLSTLRMVEPWDRGDWAGVVSIVLGRPWKDGDPVGERAFGGPERRLIGALRHGQTSEKAIRAAGESFRQLVASAGQSAIFNAIVDARQQAGLLHLPQSGDIVSIASGAYFLLSEADEADVRERAAPGRLDAFVTAPLPGAHCRHGDAASLAREQAWAADTGVDWACFDRGRFLESPGERRPVIVPLRDAPRIESGDACLRLHLSLPAGSYATEALQQMQITVPEDRRG